MSNHINQEFLTARGEMAALMGNLEWASTQVGPQQHWPQSLKTILGVILHSRFPMFVFWGPELVCFYNDAYRPSLGKDGKHPAILGMPGAEAWPEIWNVIYPMIEQVLGGGEATWSEDQLIPIYRNGQLEDVYWTFSYSCINNDDGRPYGVLVTCVETTAKMLNEQKLKESNDLLQFSTEAAELGTWDYDPLADTLKANDRLKSWFNLTSEQDIDLSIALKSVADEDRDRVAEAINAALDHHKQPGYDIEYKLIHPATRQERMVLAKGKAFFTPDGIAYRFSGTMEDVTERYIAQRILEQSEHNLRNLVEQAPVAMCVLKGANHVVEVANEKMIKLWGKTAATVMNRPMFTGLPEAKEQGLEQLLDQVYYTGERFVALERPVILPRESGLEKTYQNFVYEPLINRHGEIEGVIAVTIDVTEQVLARHRVEEAEERARLAADAANLGTFEFNIVTGKPNISPRLHEIFDVETSTTQEDVVQNIHPEDRHLRKQAIERAMRDGKLFYEVRVIHRDGIIHWVRVEGRVIFGHERKPIRILGTAIDITDTREHEQKREEYIAIASHELRNPLTSLRLSLDLLSGTIDDADKQLFLNRAKTQVRRIMSMTDELLNVSKISSGLLELKPEIFNLQESIQESLAPYRGGVSQHHFNITGEADIVIRGDRFRIEQVLVNLVSNACKYSPAGSPVTIHVSKEKDIRVEVRDRGIGIDTEKIPLLFKKFIRLESAGQVKGYGLGLYISEQVIRKHGGEIGVESEKGKGSVFWFTLPL